MGTGWTDAMCGGPNGIRAGDCTAVGDERARLCVPAAERFHKLQPMERPRKRKNTRQGVLEKRKTPVHQSVTCYSTELEAAKTDRRVDGKRPFGDRLAAAGGRREASGAARGLAQAAPPRTTQSGDGVEGAARGAGWEMGRTGKGPCDR